MISHISLKNFKCFRSLELPLRGLTLLAGLNGMGKSSVIQSLLLLRQSWQSGDLYNGRLDLGGALTDLGTGNDILFEGAEKDSIEIGIVFERENSEFDNIRIDFEFMYNKEGNQLATLTGRGLEKNINDQVLQAVKNSLPPFGGRFHYIFAERFGPRKMLPLSESHIREFNIGIRGEYVFHMLIEHGKGIVLSADDPRISSSSSTPAGLALIDQVDAWLQEISPGSHLAIEAIRNADSAVGGFFFDRPGDVATRAFRTTNVGFGLSYVLPVIVALLAAPKGALVLLENPEAHMHPMGQTRLGQLAARAAAAGVQVIIETHSDHVMDGVRIDVRSEILDAQNAAFHFFERKGAEAHVVSPMIDADGRLDSWPNGFFDQHNENLAHLLAPKS
ncbi:DUF3696 domain-containing protein [Collimonas sp. OK412]|uniref:DUF3696 domain-containing protein n=1 Tax=Collimonas sp. (strain OK412) TaxID=1801619 RepID=UPI0008DF8F45|nr:DUF3696 domain-containing protein [Collimonas sp. OK412]SFC30633.1 Predicted ATPase [Collimonas sp. OK412]